MLELRPTCEQCNKALPPDSLEARICTYECTFCVTCVDSVLGNVCPNCGGGFVPRPIRPSQNWKGDNFLGKDPASTKIKHRPLDPAAQSSRLQSRIFHRRSGSAQRCLRCCRPPASVVAYQLPLFSIIWVQPHCCFISCIN